MAGYIRLMGENEAETVKKLETYKGVMFALIKHHRGRVIDSLGEVDEAISFSCLPNFSRFLFPAQEDSGPCIWKGS